MQRYFVNKNQIKAPYIEIIGDDYHHIKNVMRNNIGDKAYVCNDDKTYLAHIEKIANDKIIFFIDEELKENKELKINVSIAQGLVRKEKMEEVVDYITELGASSYIPVIMDRSIVKYKQEKDDNKNIRLNKIAKEAAEQSHRTKILEVSKTINFKELLNISKNYDLCLYAYEKANDNDSLKKILKNKKYQNILVLIGPEGGISDIEVAALDKADFVKMSLGPRILRTQVAPLYIMSAISYEVELND